MRFAHLLWLVALSIACSGCALVQDASRNAYYNVSTLVEKHREHARNRRWAEAAWQSAAESVDESHRTADYAAGFKDGYAEYLFRGGDGEAPLLPPLHYRHVRYQNEQGYRAIADWLAGYRHGAGMARDTGARRFITGPSALAIPPPDAPGFEAPPPQALIGKAGPLSNSLPPINEGAAKTSVPELRVLDKPAPVALPALGPASVELPPLKKPVRADAPPRERNEDFVIGTEPSVPLMRVNITGIQPALPPRCVISSVRTAPESSAPSVKEGPKPE